jgi:predicted nucleic acid-binding Zn ribbon protein
VPREDPPNSKGGSEGARLAREALKRARKSADAARLEHERGAAAGRRAAIRAANVPPRPRKHDDGDPVTFGAAIGDLLDARGWVGQAKVAQVTADWAGTVGTDLAAHCQPVSLRDAVLTVEAESTTWASEIRLLSRKLLDRIADVAGPGVVTKLVVRGPVGPSWKKGRLSVPGRGPRDTYG